MIRHPVLLAALAALVIAGCAASSQRSASSGPPASPAAAQSELATLERQIDGARASLGLEPRADRAEALKLGEQATRPDRPPAPEPVLAPPARTSASELASDRAERDGCGRDPCRYTRAICEAASRICEIARYLQEADARGRCGRALQDCQQARRATRDRCPGC
jgi:hypothetical protein